MNFEQVSLLDDLIITDITAFGAEIRYCERRQRRPRKPNSNPRFQRRSLIVGITTARFLVYLMIANLADYLLQASGRFSAGRTWRFRVQHCLSGGYYCCAATSTGRGAVDVVFWQHLVVVSLYLGTKSAHPVTSSLKIQFQSYFIR